MKHALILTLALGITPLFADEPEWIQAMDKALETRRLTLNFVDAPFSDVVAFLQDISGLNVVLDSRSELGEQAVTLQVRDLPLKDALQLLLATVEAKRKYSCGALVIAKADRLAAFPAEPRRAKELAEDNKAADKLLDRKVSLNFDATPLADALAFFRDLSGLNILLDSRAKLDAALVTMRVRELTLRSALELICALTGAECKLSCGVLVVSSAEHIKRFPDATPQPPKDAPDAIKKRYIGMSERKATINFNETAAAEVVIFLNALTGEPLSLHKDISGKLPISLQVKEHPLLGVLALIAPLLDAELHLEAVGWVFAPPKKAE